MKSKCIIHIGMPKTGSTSIQKTLNKVVLNDKFSYLKIGKPNHSRAIISFCENKLPTMDGLGLAKEKLIKIDKQNKNKFQEFIKSSNSSVIIISGEQIPQVSKRGLEFLRDYLYDYFEEIVIVAYIRPPRSFMDSSLQQRIKGGRLASFKMNILYPNYKSRFEKFDEVFGTKNVKYWKFSPKSFPNSDIVLDFCQRLGIDIDEGQTLRINESLSKEALTLLYTYRKLGINQDLDKRINNKLRKKIKSIGTTKVRLSPLLTNPVLEKNSEDIKWMEERLGESLEEIRMENENDIKSEDDLLENNEVIIDKLKDLIEE